MNIEKISVEKLNPAEYNPRKDLKPGDTEYEKLKKSIETFGYVEPVIWNKRTGNIVGGHQRYKILKDQGATGIECVVVDMDEVEEKALNIALNKVSGEWDNEKLVLLISDLNDSAFDISLTGFEAAEVEELFNEYGNKEVNEDDFDVDEALKEPTMSKQGDVWLLGRHRLVCGDSTEAKTYEVLMDGKKANLVVTDPPYNIDIQGGTKDKLKIQNDNMTDKEFYDFLFKFYKCTFDVMEDGASIYVFHADTEGINFRTALKNAGFHLSGVCIWVKNSLVLGRMNYHFRHEPILFAWKPTGTHSWYSDHKQTTIWEFDRPTKSKLHPTMKPLNLLAYPITNSSMTNCIVLDPFGGSGSTLIACEQTNRICFTIELDEKYADVIVKRWIEQVQSDDEVFLIRDGEKTAYKDIKKDE